MRLIPETTFQNQPFEVRREFQLIRQRLNDGILPNGEFLGIQLYNRADQTMQVGDIVVVSQELPRSCTLTDSASNIRRCGVVTARTEVGLIAPIAMMGMVPCRIQGTVNTGDIITTSTAPGIGIANNAATMEERVGFALESVAQGSVPASGISTINILLTV